MAVKYAFLVDSSRCTGCRACEIACKNENKLPMGPRWRRLRSRETGKFPDLKVVNASISCNHCEDPACMRVCPAGAYTKRPDGLVIHDAEKCIGCRYCVMACPYGAPQFNEETGRVGKCRACLERLQQGLEPACVRICMYDALDFGDINDPNSNISQRIKKSGAMPVPGTSLFYIPPDGRAGELLPGEFQEPAAMHWWLNIIRPGGKIVFGAAAAAVAASLAMGAIKKEGGKDNEHR
ncbi:4Fe-4S dicluster domain protein [Neomoorella glycerini]|uniref:4Fe-4S dicluster domain protein n=1 Tax=Neomoorella glycerini TaxID=55779 RepID=A0A6I5ZLU1_9FIRM|nr:4Fe-4S dicluster domain-containing protein [Moorella glycerini]QGP90860.1 4Fe-4S dicluster domain protein [Moorella glycerini]